MLTFTESDRVLVQRLLDVVVDYQLVVMENGEKGEHDVDTLDTLIGCLNYALTNAPSSSDAAALRPIRN